MLNALKSEPADEISRIQLRQMIMGYQISRCVCVAAKLGIADLLEDRPKSIGELATATRTQATSLDASTVRVEPDIQPKSQCRAQNN
jgi:hypothetical protein